MTTNPSITAVAHPDWLPADDYPFQLRSIDLGTDSVTYIDEGAGPTLLFVHTGMWSFIFRDVILRLRDDFRCITLDFPGYGLSPDPIGDELDLADQGELLAEFVERLSLSDITLVLHDLGGVVGMAFAAQRANLIAGIVMANTFAWKPDDKALVRMLRIVSSRPVTVLDRVTRFIPRLTRTRFGVGRHLSRSGKRAFLGPFQGRGRTRRIHSLMRNAIESDTVYERIEAATAGPLQDRPVLTIFGERNDPFGFEDRHHATFPNHVGVVVAKGNHFPMMDDPDLFADSVRGWLRRLG